jgi:hypothetical protein
MAPLFGHNVLRIMPTDGLIQVAVGVGILQRCNPKVRYPKFIEDGMA